MRSTQIVVGMPASGKSTFIAALRYCVTAPDVDSCLQLTHLSENEVHLNKLEERWISCEQVERTKEATGAWVTFHVKNRVSSTECELSVPDLLGEAFKQPAALGRCRRSLYDAMIAADGLILFTNASRGTDDLMITSVGDLIDALEGGPKGEDGAEDVGVEEPKKFDPEDMPEEANLVELLQMMNRRPLIARRRRLAIIISAWDVVEPGELLPASWFHTNRPMLSQFLDHNSDSWEVRVFGVSAQGGVLPRDQEALQRLKPSMKTKVVGPDAGEHDLSAPISWIMDRDE